MMGTTELQVLQLLLISKGMLLWGKHQWTNITTINKWRTKTWFCQINFSSPCCPKVKIIGQIPTQRRVCTLLLVSSVIWQGVLARFLLEN